MRIALALEYDGHPYFGWQRQEHVPTVQRCVEDALSKIANEPVQVFCAGRTDAGVHALEQVIHFDTQAHRDLRAWTHGSNNYLPSSIAVRWAKEVPDDFHARFSASARRYRYLIYNAPLRPAIQTHQVTWFYQPLNEKRMQKAADYLIGEKDFSSFRSSQCESKTPMRNVKEIIVTRNQEWITIEIEANAFLHHMVRNIVGVLVKIGSGFKNPEWMQEVLLAKDRRQAAETAPPQGLYLIKVTYRL